MYTKITETHLRYFSSIVGADRCSTHQETLQAYSHDETEDLRFPPEVVLFPQSALEISDVLKYCTSHQIPVTPVGARTGLSGGMLTVYGGVALSTSKMNAILEIDTKDHVVSFNGSVQNARGRVDVLADFIKLAPGPNTIEFEDTGNPEGEATLRIYYRSGWLG